jgi:glycosyltransferase involved in cell wall biosynthesis
MSDALAKAGRKLTSISLVFPAYNEELNVERAVAEARATLEKYADRHEIIMVNDGSADKTGSILDELARKNSDVVPVHHPKNRGYGAALCSGFAQAKMDYVFFSDSDLQFNLDEMDRLIAWIDQYDIVTGYREKRADSAHRKLNAFAWGTLVRMLFGIKVRDIDCAFKLFNRRVFDQIKLQSAGAMVNTEILALAIKYGFTIKEVPVTHLPRAMGQQTGANLKVIIKAFKELFAMYNRLKHYVPTARQ